MAFTDDLERLAALHRAGALTDAEFADAKTRALGGSTNSRADAVVGSLHALHRSRTDRWLGGVCGGLGRTTGLPAWLWRLVFVSMLLCAGAGVWIYLLLWVLLPKEAARFDSGNSTGSFRPV